MGLFSTKKKIYVSSTVYKIIDDGSDRAPFIRETIAGVALSRTADASYADAIMAGIQRGPRSIQRRFFNWCKNNIDGALPRAAINYTETIDDVAVAAEILASEYGGDGSNTINIVSSFVDTSDESYYAERWILENRSTIAEVDWAADKDFGTDDILIQWPAGQHHLGSPIFTDTITEPSFDPSDQLILSYYTVTNGGSTGPIKLFIYVLGSGNAALDSRVVQITDGSANREFYPILPLWYDNQNALTSGSPAYGNREAIREAWRRSLGSEIDDAISEIANNPDIGDIDYAYLVYGVALNTTDIAEKKYLFEFFRLLGENQTIPNSAFQTARASNDAAGYNPSYNGNNQLMLNERLLTLDPVAAAQTATYNTAPQLTQLRIQPPSTAFGKLDITINWNDITETRHTGLMNYGAKVGDVDIKKKGLWEQSVEFSFESGVQTRSGGNPSIIISKQISTTEYIELEITGLSHKNNIYSGKAVDITAWEALDDPDPSGFIIPLHEPTLKRVGAVIATDVAREGYYIVFNSYQVVKKKWYQTGIFAFILAVVVVVVVAVVTVVTAGAGTPAAASAGAGILGSAAAVGAALGFSGLLAVAVGAAANAIAAMLVLQLVSAGGTALFGEKIGKILTAVAAAIMVMGTGPNGFSMSNVGSGWGNLAAIDKLAMMTNAASDIAGVLQQEKIDEILAETKQVMEDYEDEMRELKEMMAQLEGEDIIDPMMLTDFTSPLNQHLQMGPNFQLSSTFGETPEDFLSRTLLTGSELIDISHAMVTDFVDATLTLR